MQTLFKSHTALFLKHARRILRPLGNTIPVEDVAREAELLLGEVSRATGGRDIASPDALIRTVIRSAAGRVKRRRTLIDQIAAGDDLEAMSRDLASVDKDVPEVLGAPSREQSSAYEVLLGLKRGGTPGDALYGYNHNGPFVGAMTGPGYYVAHAADPGEVA
ncbi:hypothetical protein EON77_21050, partial [bacterium]